MNPGNSFGIISKQIGSLLKLLGIVIVIPSIVSAIYGELYSFLGFLLSGFIILSLGISLRFFFSKSEDIHYKQALIVVAASWLLLTFAGGLPFYIIANITPEKIMQSYIPENSGYEISSLYYFRNYLHCFFESMSAFTTTGLSMAVHEPSVGKGVLFYRSFAQWIGGAGFIIMVLAIFREISGKGAILLYGSESTGEKLQPKVISTARSIWKVYVIVTLFSFVYLIVGTSIILPGYPLSSNIFDSLNHAMTGQSTGGFSVLDDSIAGYQSPYMDMLYLLPMILGSFSLPFFYKVIILRKFGQFWHDIQTRYLILAFICGSVIQSLLLLRADSVPEPFREGVFQFISGMSTTGWQTSNMAKWDWISIVFISFTAMFIGGASGATVGGIKMIRAILIEKVLRFQVKKTFYSSNVVKIMKFNHKTLMEEDINGEFTKAITIAFLFFVLILLSSILVTCIMGDITSFPAALVESASAQCTVGLSSGITDPSIPDSVELIYIFQMWSGRLEIIPVLALIRAIVLGTNPFKN